MNCNNCIYNKKDEEQGREYNGLVPCILRTIQQMDFSMNPMVLVPPQKRCNLGKKYVKPVIDRNTGTNRRICFGSESAEGRIEE